ncbi:MULTISPECIES: C40 family peptidase [Pseudomonas]|uniref:hypothetical protein n=1 Tax=Pseudomonas TaxID=286 RepID=UPI0003D33A7C|nr:MULTISPECIES: hypothetical protein [Pseudomonas]AZD26983.1 hypothetical protein C4K23_0202 [Pseudomonas chlororaphis]ETD35105.1 hypothetical protein U724_26605 [Pseudomonas chlororaphis subsp. aurantiaca PB-St2]QFS58233.1 hypothetical protein FD951_28015 [Pseudomonas chlororaphis subsp. aurantiaca]QLL13702.1 hypothetical protein H0I86_01020 [Pseudomonas chlororaphis subsp. aurantiaca]QQZ42339.1 hypothetical protein IF690_02030 [Pseudomonas sp. SK3(2021)]
MQPGDIVFSVAQVDDKLSTSIPRAFIRAGQWIKAKMFGDGSPNVPVVHAAIAISDTCVIESVGSGIQMTDLSSEAVKRSAMVYSCADDDLARAAVVAAEQFNGDVGSTQISGRYSVWNAALSVFKRTPFTPELQARINESVAIGNVSFCSQFVANSYEVGNLYNNANLLPPPPAVFDTRPTAMTPWDLASSCDSDGKFYFAGFWQDGIEVRL